MYFDERVHVHESTRPSKWNPSAEKKLAQNHLDKTNLAGINTNTSDCTRWFFFVDL